MCTSRKYYYTTGWYGIRTSGTCCTIWLCTSYLTLLVLRMGYIPRALSTSQDIASLYGSTPTYYYGVCLYNLHVTEHSKCYTLFINYYVLCNNDTLTYESVCNVDVGECTTYAEGSLDGIITLYN